MNFISWLLGLFGLGLETKSLKKDGKQLFYGLLAYSWSGTSTSNRRKLINALVAEGWTGITFELMERFAWWPRGDTTSDLVGDMKKKIDALVPWLEDCNKAGLWVYVIDNNSNGDTNKKVTLDQLKEIAQYLVKKCGSYKNLIRLPVSEKDSDLNAAIRSAYINYVEGTWPDYLTSSMDNRRGAAKWAETHQGSVSNPAPGGGWTMIAVSDTGSILMELCGSVTGSKMNQDKAAQWVTSMLKGGNSVCLYALGTGIDIPMVEKIGKIGKANGV